ncbi:hypothetical protein ACS0TY_014033 [Phlomoides rotata]
MKVISMRESKDLSKITTFELFSDLKAYEFDIDRRKDEETPSSKVTTLVATESNLVADSEYEQDELALFIKKFRKFVKGGKSTWKKNPSKPTAEGKDSKTPKGITLMDIYAITAGSQGISSRTVHTMRPRNIQMMKRHQGQKEERNRIKKG